MKSLIGGLFLFSCVASTDAWTSSSSSAFLRGHWLPTTRTSRRTSSRSQLQMALDLSSLTTLTLDDIQLVTESATSGLLCGTADVLAQAREKFFGIDAEKTTTVIQRPQRDPVDLGRVARFAMKGLIGGIIWSTWFGINDVWSTDLSLDALSNLSAWLDSVGVDASSWTDMDMTKNAGRVVTATVLEQCIASPLIFAFWDLPIPLLLSGRQPSEIPGQVFSKIGPLLISNAKVWSIANLVVYSAPLEWRVIVMSMVDLFWQSVVASAAASDADSETTQGEVEVSPQDEFPLNARIIEKDDVSDLAARLRP